MRGSIWNDFFVKLVASLNPPGPKMMFDVVRVRHSIVFAAFVSFFVGASSSAQWCRGRALTPRTVAWAHAAVPSTSSHSVLGTSIKFDIALPVWNRDHLFLFLSWLYHQKRTVKHFSSYISTHF